MSPGDACLAALATALDPGGAPARLRLAACPDAADEAIRLAALPRQERLLALAAALDAVEPGGDRQGAAASPSSESPRLARALERARAGEDLPGSGRAAQRLLRRAARQTASRAAERTLVRGPARVAAPGPGPERAGRMARPVEGPGAVLPFQMPRVGRGQAEVDASVASLGARAARLAADALAGAMGVEVRVEGRVLRDAPGVGAAAVVPVDLSALPGTALLAVECGLAAALADRLAGGPGDRCLATSLTPAEAVVLDLLALAAVDGISALPEVATFLSPRLGRDAAPPDDPVVLDLRVAAGGIEGRAALFLPLAAIRAIRGSPELPDAIAQARVEGSLRSGRTHIERAELAAAAPGDVLLLEEPPGERAAFAWPGGGRAVGRLVEGGLAVEEVDVARMTPAASEAPLLVEVDLGPAAVTLGDLARLEPGGVLPLGIEPIGRVTLRLGDRVLGVGVLVEVDGAVAVRVLALGEGA